MVTKDINPAQGTITADAPMLDGTVTWNAVGVTFTAWKLNVTDTASAAASLLIDLQVGGTSQFKVTKGGAATFVGGVTSDGHLLWTTDNTYDIGASGATRPRDIFLSRNAIVGSTIELGDASDTTLSRAAAGSLAVEGVAVPTISSTSTLSNKTFSDLITSTVTGPAFANANVDSQIYLGTTTDNGWTIPAVIMRSAGSGGAALFSLDSSQMVMGINIYYDGSRRDRSTDVATRLLLDNTSLDFSSFASGTAGNALASQINQFVVSTSGATLGAPTGGAKGSGTLNATGVYDDNTLLTDWLFDLHYDGKILPTRTGRRISVVHDARGKVVSPAHWEGPPRGAPTKPHHKLFTLAEVSAVTVAERRLPWMPTEAEFEQERHLGGLLSRLWQGQEQQQLYLFQLEARIKALEV